MSQILNGWGGGMILSKLKLSVIITAKSRDDPKLIALLKSINSQSYPKSKREILVITEGDSESAKAIGLKKAKGDIICILASDNYLNDTNFFTKCIKPLKKDNAIVGSFPIRYHHTKSDNILNRYFALIGCNDPLPLYLGKNDKIPYYEDIQFKDYVTAYMDYVPTLGDNGFFIWRQILLKADIDHYYHIDVCQDLLGMGYNRYALVNTSIWHRTGGNIVKFFLKRYKYADKFNTPHRRWRMVEEYEWPLVKDFIISTLCIYEPLMLSIAGYRKVHDIAWFLHWPVCVITIGVYGLWVLKRRLLSVVTNVKRNLTVVLNR